MACILNNPNLFLPLLWSGYAPGTLFGVTFSTFLQCSPNLFLIALPCNTYTKSVCAKKPLWFMLQVFFSNSAIFVFLTNIIFLTFMGIHFASLPPVRKKSSWGVGRIYAFGLTILMTDTWYVMVIMFTKLLLSGRVVKTL